MRKRWRVERGIEDVEALGGWGWGGGGRVGGDDLEAGGGGGEGFEEGAEVGEGGHGG